MADLLLRSTADDMYEVCLEEDGIRACCFVSSMHLVHEKEKQLRDSIKRQTLNSFIENAANKSQI